MKILIADDHELFLKGLEFFLKMNFPEAELTTAQNYSQIFSKLEKKHNFDLIITDLAMPDANWLDAISRIHALAGEAPIVIISAVFDKGILQKTIEAGVAAYIPKSSSNQLMLSAINLVLAGGVYIPHELLENHVDNQELNQELHKIRELSEPKSEETTKKLTPRQIDVIKGIAKGLPNKLIAHELGLTEGTVKVHITVILKTLGVNNRTGAVMEAVKKGYISRDEVSM